MADLDLSHEHPLDPVSAPPAIALSQPKSLDDRREEARGDLARGLLWLLTFAVGGVLAFVGLGRIDGTVITQSIFPSLVALAGTALGFYFGSGKVSDSGSGSGGVTPVPPVVPRQVAPDNAAGSGGNVQPSDNAANNKAADGKAQEGADGAGKDGTKGGPKADGS